jgi:CMP-N,N'-diacetyllegionaminic acid synthase
VAGEIIGLIPARGGSKGIPGKNLAPLAGRPLLAHTADAARAARCLSRTILSTDDPAIAAAGRGLGLEVPFLRPPALAGDDTPMLPVLVHALDWCRDRAAEPEIVVLLQPTSPLRRAADIDAAVGLMTRAGAETVVSVMAVPHRFTPASLMAMDTDGSLRSLDDGPMVLRRQDKALLYARNGPAILAVRATALRRGTLYGEPTLGYEMDAESSLDIDDPEDLWLAEQYLRRRDAAAAR